MTIDEITTAIKTRLKETGHEWSDEKIRAKASEVYSAGIEKIALVGEAAINAEKHGDENYSPDQHLKVLTGGF